MKGFILRPAVNQIGIEYFYLSNLALAGRKFWIREEYNQKFIEGHPFGYVEWRAVRTLGKIISDLESREKQIHLLEIFFSPKPWQKLAKAAGRPVAVKVKKIFKLLKPRWEKFFREKLTPEIIEGLKNLKRVIRINQKFIQAKWQELEIIYGYSPPNRTVTVFWIPLPKEIRTGGGKYLPALNAILLEANSVRAGQSRTLEIILHESIHLLLETEHFQEDINRIETEIPKKIKKKILLRYNIPSLSFGLREIIATALTITPPSLSGSTPYTKLLAAAPSSLQPLLEKYSSEGKVIDLYFIRHVLKFWMDQLKKRRPQEL